jgi:polysaccharide deacetylase 2 family uncharacterized protein YibQ
VPPVETVAAPALAAAATTASAPVSPSTAKVAADDVETESGVRVIRNGGSSAPGALIIHVPEPLGVQLNPAPDRRLVEKSAHGSLPKIGADGSRPADVYARPLVTAGSLKPDAPRLALIIGGMGISQNATDHAVSVLPGAVTLAFAPYGTDLDKQAAHARAEGHEILLQMPMEPFDAGQSPGPHTLQAALSPEQNRDHLHWAMTRFSGYVGVMNFLGAKFTAQEATLAPVLHEVAGRGLLYVDDGSSARSVAPSVAVAQGLPSLQADVAIDTAPTREGLDKALARLESLARERGFAIGVASGLPATVDRLADFARGLERRGIALVPLSAVAATPMRPAVGMVR